MGINPRAISVETDLAALDPRQPGIQKMQGIVRFSHLNSANSAGLASGEQHPLTLNAIDGPPIRPQKGRPKAPRPVLTGRGVWGEGFIAALMRRITGRSIPPGCQ